MTQLVAGVDVSTQQTKVVVVDIDDGRVVASGAAPNLVVSGNGASETHPDAWWSALGDALHRCGVADRIAAISVAGQQHGLVVLDGRGRVLRPAILWNDTRSAPDAERLRATFDATFWCEQAAGPPVASFTLPSWSWLRRTEPDTAARVRAIRLPHDWVTQRLCGAGVTDRGDASGTGWFSPSADDYSDAVLDHELIAIDRGMLPEVAAADTVVGETSDAARELGLSPGTLVAPGTGDNMAAALGLGALPGQPVVSLGTSGTLYTVADHHVADRTAILAGFADATGRYLPLACTLNCTLAVDRFAQWLGLDRGDVAASSDGVVVLPFLDGERTPNLPTAQGSIHGLTHRTSPQQVLLAAYEGAVASLVLGLDVLATHVATVHDRDDILVTGGGARGEVWRRTLGRLTGREVVVPEPAEHVAIGAAAQAAAALTGRPSTGFAAEWARHRGYERARYAVDEETRERLLAAIGAS